MAVAHWVKGDPVDISSGVHVLEFWATWCPPCKVAIPHLNKLYVEKYKKAGVQLVGVTKEDEKTVKPFIEVRFVCSLVAEGFGVRTGFTGDRPQPAQQ